MDALRRLAVIAILAAPTPGLAQGIADSIPAVTIVELAAEALGADDLADVGLIAWTEVGVQRWSGQGSDRRNPTRVRHIRRRIVADRTRQEAYRLMHQMVAGGAIDWCEEVWLDRTAVVGRDCLSGVAAPHRSAPRDPAEAVTADLPHATLRALARSPAADTAVAVRSAPDAPWRLSVPVGPGAVAEWHFDPTSYLPLALVGPDRDVFGRSALREDRWSDWSVVDGVAMPGTVTRTRADRRASEVVALTDIRLGAATAGLVPGRPEVVPSAPSPGPHVERVGPGAWLLMDVVPTYNALLVTDGTQSVLVDPPGGPEGARAATDLIERAGAPPVRTIVLTHAHPDHHSAVPWLGLSDAVVLAPEAAAQGAEGALRRPVRGVASDTVLAGGLVLAVLDARPHVDAMLVPVVTELRAAFVADLYFTGPTGPLRPAGDEAEPLRWFLRTWTPAVDLVWSAHGASFTPGELAEAMDSRAADPPPWPDARDRPTGGSVYEGSSLIPPAAPGP